MEVIDDLKALLVSRGKFCNNRALGLFIFCTIANQQALFLFFYTNSSKIYNILIKNYITRRSCKAKEHEKHCDHALFLSRDQAISRVESRNCGENHTKTTLSTFGCHENILSKNLQKFWICVVR